LLARYVAGAAPRQGALPPALQERITTVYWLSAGFAAWDRFEHPGALDTLSRYGDFAQIASLLNALRQLAENKTRKVQAHGGWRWLPPDNPLLPLDLWHNAQRRAHRQRYDDAIARCYRLVEATVQWVLYTELDGLDTFEVRRDQLGEELAAQLDRRGDGKPLKLGLEQALDVMRVRLPEHWLTVALGPKVLGAKRSRKTPALTALLQWKEKRNQSILAHGFEPLARNVWQEVERWVEEYLAPPLVAEARAAGLSLPQLPTELPVV
jgi:CRISPR-associated protein (TIGR02710 family)